MILKYVLTVAAGYLLGSISCSILVSKLLFKIDIRTRGSGNAGATNVARNFGIPSGLLTFLGDALKTVLAVTIGGLLAGPTGQVVAGAACLVGHCWPLFFRFKGGKGVTVGAALTLMLDWRVFLVCMAVFVVLVAITHIVSLGSVVGSALLPFACIFFGVALPKTLLLVFAALLIIVQHRANIRRLLHHQEPKFVPKSTR